MTTTTESNMLNMHQSPLVLGWGQNAINASYPINAKRLQIVYPSSGRVNPWTPNQNLEFRQLIDKNAAMSLHGSYFQVTFSVGRLTEWLPQAAATGGASPTETTLKALDVMDRMLLYSHWNPCRLIQNCTLFLGATNVETCNNVPLISDAKYPFYSPDAVKTTMSDCFVNPPDGHCSLNGAPLIHPIKSLSTGNNFQTWHDTSVTVWGYYSIQPKNDPANAASFSVPPGTGAPYAPALACGPMPVQPLEYFLRNGQYAVPLGIQYNDIATSVWNSAQLQFCIPSAESNFLTVPPANCNISYFDYAKDSNSSSVPTVAGGVTTLGPYPSGALKNTLTSVTKRIPLSSIFGFCEANVLVPSNLIQINLVRARDDQFITNLFYPVGVSNTSVYSNCPPRQYGICVTNMYLVLKYFDLNQTAADLLSQDQLLTVNHYSVYSNEVAGLSGGGGSISLQSYAGLKSLIVRVNPSWAVCGASIPVAQCGNIAVIYRGKQSPLQLQNWNVILNPPLPASGSAINVYQGGPMLAADPSTYFEEYSSWNGNCWNGLSAALAPSAGHNIGTWFKSQFTVVFNFVEDQSQNADTVAAPIQLNYNFGMTPLYAIDQNVIGTPPKDAIAYLPDHLGGMNAKNTLQAVFLRTNLIKYLGASRQFVFVTNGSS